MFLRTLIISILLMSNNAYAAYEGQECTLVYKKCLDSSSKDVNGTMMTLQEIEPSAPDNCWEYTNVYRCVDDSWTDDASCSGISGQGYQLTNAKHLVEYYQTYYPGTNLSQKLSSKQNAESTKQTDMWVKFYDNPYRLSCDTTLLNDQASGASIATFDNAVTAMGCVKNSGWDSVGGSTVTDSYGGKSFNFAHKDASGNVKDSQKISSWTCVTDVTNSCTATDIKECSSSGDPIGVSPDGEENPKLPNDPVLGQYPSGTATYACDLKVTTVCDSTIQSCGSPISSSAITHDKYDYTLGTENKYLCYGDSDLPVCDREAGYDSCQWSYYECNDYDYDIVPSENTYDGRNYGQCKNWTDHYICPNEVVVTCNDELNNCGDATLVSETTDKGGKVEHWVDEYVCYNGAIDQSCDDPDGNQFYGCIKVGTTCLQRDPDNVSVPDPILGDCVDWVDDYVCPSSATYECDGDITDCRAPVVREGSSESSDDYTGTDQILYEQLETSRVDDYYCWNGAVDTVCDIDDDIDTSQCDWTGYRCHEEDPSKAQPNIVDGRDYGYCVDWTDNWVCSSSAETTCNDDTLTDCGPADLQDGGTIETSECILYNDQIEYQYQLCLYEGDLTEAECRANNQPLDCAATEGTTEDSKDFNPDDVPVGWTEKYVCYTGDYIEACQTGEDFEDLKQCTKTGFTCLLDDPDAKDPDPYYGTCVSWIDRYACGHLQYETCDTDYEMCTTKEITETADNPDGVEVLSRTVEYCYTGDINTSQCVLDEDKCYIYDENSDCQNQYINWEASVQTCLDAGGTATECSTANPEPQCRTEVECPVGDRFGVSCQIDWDNYVADMAVCTADTSKTQEECSEEVGLPECTPELTPYIDCPHSGFTCNQWNYDLTAEEAADNNYEGRNYGYCVDWSDRYTCPQFQTEDCTADIDKSECGPLGYVEIDEVVDGAATGYTTIIQCVDGAPADCTVDESCTISDTVCVESKNGLCSRYQRIFECTVNRTDCVAWDTSCLEDDAVDWSVPNEHSNNIGEMIAKASVAKMIADNTELDAGAIRIFGGRDRSCRRMDDFNVRSMLTVALGIYAYTQDVTLLKTIQYWSMLMLIDYDCCQIDNSAQKKEALAAEGETCDSSSDEDCDGYEQDILSTMICSNKEVELSKARGAKHVVGPLGSECSVDILGFCLENERFFCEFDNLFARIVQEQGRSQIESALASGSSDSEQLDLSFTYYNQNGTNDGGWTVQTVNGNKIAYWQWDPDCRNYLLDFNPTTSASTNLAPICPYYDEVHIASCDGSGCNKLPSHPYTNETAAGEYTDFTLTVLDPYVKMGQSVGPNMFISGECGSASDLLQIKTVFFPTDFYKTGESVVLTIPEVLGTNGQEVARFVSARVSWGDGNSESFVYVPNDGGYFIAEHEYFVESGSSGNLVQVNLTDSKGNIYTSHINFYVNNAATDNPNRLNTSGYVTYSVAGIDLDYDQCEYSVSAYPGGAGAKKTVGYDISWMTNGYEAKWSDYEYYAGPNVVVPFENGSPTGVNLSSTVKIKINDQEYDLPADTGGKEVSVGPLIFVGQCNNDFYTCSYKMYRTAVMELMPWGSGSNVNCRGFSAEEIEMLDFSAMDLSEWIATILPKPPSEDEILDKAEADVEANKDDIANGIKVTGGEAKVVFFKTAIGHPHDEMKLVVTPKVLLTGVSEEVFNHVTINWGDGTSYDVMDYESSTGYVATHKYRKESGTDGFIARISLQANSGRNYETTVRFMIGFGYNSSEFESLTGGGVIKMDNFKVNGAYDSSLYDSTKDGGP